MGMLGRRALAGGVAALLLARRARAADEGIVLASTTSVDNSGLLPAILPGFTAGSGVPVRVLALGTGQALAVASRGDADLVLVHDPEAEDRFMAAGYGAVRRRVAWNDFIIVGSSADPAAIAGKPVLPAMQAVWASSAPWVARGDSSGTDAKEKRLWAAAGLDPKQAGAWYKDIGGGMGAALNAAAAMGAYTLSDRGTWLSFGNRGGMRVVVEGGRDLVNLYEVITLTPAGHRPEGRAGAQALADWLVYPAGQAAIAGYQVGGQALFHPVADPMP
jgi:tungstate transport system substrate-binding protein